MEAGTEVTAVAGRHFVFVTYYGPPYRSGLTIHAGRVMEGLVAAGAAVSLIVGQHDKMLPRREAIAGVDVRRLPVAARVDRGILLPSLVPVVLRAAARANAIVLITPLAEAGLLAALLRSRIPLAVHHVCDPHVPGGGVGRVLVAQADRSARAAIRRASLVLALSRDYAEHSRVLGDVLERVVAIPPAMDLTPFFPDSAVRADRPAGTPLRVGFLGRLTHEKGLDRLIAAVARLRNPARLILAGATDGVAGGTEAEKLRAQSVAMGVDVEFPGVLPDVALPDFYRSLDVFALPSVSSLEAWGLVQVEAMLCGTPVVASALPGVRVPIQRTGMGLTVRPDDVSHLAQGIAKVAADRGAYIRSRQSVIDALGLEQIVQRYVAAIGSLTVSPHGAPDGDVYPSAR